MEKFRNVLSNEHQGCSEEKRDYDAMFAKRMSAAGITPDHHIGIAVSGGADSMALCILLCHWIHMKKNGDYFHDAGLGKLVGLVVDHGLRTDSAVEALRVQNWLSKLGIRCEVLKCLWTEGVPAQGHLQEAARNARYELLQEACKRNGLQVLLTGHHADDQVELFVIRLSRHSGLAGLAGIPFVSEMFRQHIPDCSRPGFNKGLLLVRPLLDFNKADLYHLCRKSCQPWVEDPTNHNPTFLRNKVRKVLSERQFCLMRKELQHVITLCRKTRFVLDRGRDYLLLKAVSINQDYGYAIMDLEKLSLSPENDRFLSRAVVAVLQFVAQKDRPPRGRAVQTLLERIYNGNSKGALTLGGCYVCAAPGSKGSRILICVSCDSQGPFSTAPVMSVLPYAHNNGQPYASQTVESLLVPDSLKNSTPKLDLETPFSKMKDSTDLICEAKRANIISDFSISVLSKLTSGLSMEFNNKKGEESYKGKMRKVVADGRFKSTASNYTEQGLLRLPSGHACYFMNRFLVSWGKRSIDDDNIWDTSLTSLDLEFPCSNPIHGGKVQQISCCFMQENNNAWVRSLNDKDWIMLSHLAKSEQAEKFISQCFLGQDPKQGRGFPGHFPQHSSLDGTNFHQVGQDLHKLHERKVGCGRLQDSSTLALCGDSLIKKAQEALVRLKGIPLPVRRGLPVLITAKGTLLGIPSLQLGICPHIWMFSSFCPKVPLGGGCTSWL